MGELIAGKLVRANLRVQLYPTEQVVERGAFNELEKIGEASLRSIKVFMRS